MQVKVIKNMIHEGISHFVGSVIHVKDELVADLEEKGFIDPNVTQNPAAQTEVKPEEPAHTEEVKPQEETKPEEQPAQTQEENKVEEQKEGEQNGEQEQAETGKEETQENQ